MIVASEIELKSGEKTILNTFSLTFEKSEFIAVIGPNGAGKSSLLKVLSGIQKPSKGNVLLDGTNILSWNVKALAKRRAFLQQQNTVFGDFNVREILEMGRYPYCSKVMNTEEEQLIQEALQKLGLEKKIDQNYHRLSGGEQQRVQFGRVMLQLEELDAKFFAGKYLFLDEPLNNLDLKYQLSLLHQAKNQVVLNGGTVVAVLHDINMAYQFADRILILKNGNLIVDNETSVALDENILSSIFEVNMKKINSDSNQYFFLTETNTTFHTDLEQS